MLYLTAGAEKPVIGSGIRVTILDTNDDRVKLGFVAPDDIPIRRLEINAPVKPSGPSWNTPSVPS